MGIRKPVEVMTWLTLEVDGTATDERISLLAEDSASEQKQGHWGLYKYGNGRC